jgi:uncharacterized membrane protein YidH (DUF202 family)
MFNSSMAILQRPSVATFEEHEKNDLQGATIYVAIAAVIAGILAALTAAIGGAPTGFLGVIIGAVLFTLVFFYFYMGVVYLLGRAFGGTGNFGELAYDIALFYAPLMVVRGLLGIIPILGAIAALIVTLYSIYLTYLGIQSGMNLPKDKAIWVMAIIFLVIVAIVACIAIFFFAIFAAIMNGGNR